MLSDRHYRELARCIRYRRRAAWSRLSCILLDYFISIDMYANAMDGEDICREIALTPVLFEEIRAVCAKRYSEI